VKEEEREGKAREKFKKKKQNAHIVTSRRRLFGSFDRKQRGKVGERERERDR